MRIQERNNFGKLSHKRPQNNWSGIPAIIKPYDTEGALFDSFLPSLIFHIVAVLFCWFLISTLHIGENAAVLKQKEKMQDIEFELSNPHQHRKTVESISPSVDSLKPVENNTNPEPKDNSKPTQKVKQTQNPTNKSSNVVSTTPTPSDFSIPIPKIKPLFSSSGRTASNNKSVVQSTDLLSTESEAGNGGSIANGAKSGTSFNKDTTRKVIASYDISPYVNELKRNIRWNWKAPKGHEHQRVELFLRIAKDGRLMILNVKKTSEIAEVDNAALDAVRKAQPLNHLPSGYQKGYLDVVFNFDSSNSTIMSK